MPLKLCALGTYSVNEALQFALEIESSLRAVIYGLNKKKKNVFLLSIKIKDEANSN